MSQLLPSLPSLLNLSFSLPFYDGHSVFLIILVGALDEGVAFCFFEFSVLQIFFPSSNQIVSIIPFIFSFSVLFPLQNLSCVGITVWVDQDSLSFHFIIVELAFVMDRLHVQFTFSLLLVVFKVAFIISTTCKSEFAKSIKLAVFEFTDVLTVPKLISSFPIFLIILKISFVFTLLLSIYQCSFAAFFAIPKGALVQCILEMVVKFAFAMKFVVQELAFIHQFSSDIKFAFPIHLSVLEGTFISFSIDIFINAFNKKILFKPSHEPISIFEGIF